MFKYSILLLWKFVVVDGFQVGTPVPGISGLGCPAIGSTQYAVGGFLGLEGSGANLQVYSLDLENLNPPIWKPTNILLRQGAAYAGIVRQGNTNGILVLGGYQIKLGGGFYSIDTGDQTSGILQLNSPTFPESGTTVFPYGGGFVANDQDSSEYIYYGGIQFKGDLSAKSFINYVKRYNIDTKTWTSDNSTSGPQTSFNTGNVYKGGLYVLGGVTGIENVPTSLMNVWRYDLDDKTWSQLACKGENVGSRSHHSAVISGNSLYLVGGLDNTTVDNKINILNLDSLTWSTMKVPGLQGKALGCLALYNYKLVYSFGSPFTNTATTIDLASSKTVNSPTLVPLGTLLGIIFGCIFGIVFLTLVVFFFYRRYKRIRLQNEQYQAQYAEQMRMYNEAANNFPAPLETDIETFTAVIDSQIGGPDPFNRSTELSQDSMLSNPLNIEVPKEWSNGSR